MKIRDVTGANADPLLVRLLLEELELPGGNLDVELNDRQIFAIAVFHHIHCIPWLNNHQRTYLIGQLSPAVYNTLAPWEFTLAFCNGQFVTWNGLNGFFDLKTGGYGKTAPPVFESIAYNFQTRMNALLNEARQGCPSPPETSG